MPKSRQTCTRCSQRRQKCDRKQPCTRCVQNNESHLCTTTWTEGYNPSVHRRYPKKPSVSVHSASSSNEKSTTTSPSATVPVRANTGTSPGISTGTNLLDRPERFNIGESRVVDISVGSLLNEKDTPSSDSTLFDQSFNYVSTAGKLRSEGSRIVNCISPAAKAVEVYHIRALLPEKEVVFKIVDYYGENMLYWAGGIYHAPSFRKQLMEYYGSSSHIDTDKTDWRWMGLLLAILASGMIGSPETLSLSWGYSLDDKVRVSRDWGTAAVTALTLGNYTSQYHICSVHAIFILHAYEHLAGSTNQWAALRSVAVVIARGLGLHRLSEHPDDSRVSQLNEEEKNAFVEREVGRRTWMTIVTQEWLCAASQAYNMGTIQKRQFTTVLPMDLDEQTMVPIKGEIPTLTSIERYFYAYGSILLSYNNAMADAVDIDDTTRYAMVIKFEGDLRATCAENMPKCLNPRIPLDPTWPRWVKWARTLHQASTEHKLIMLHQNFLSKSFRDVRYTYTRWACANSAKRLIGLYQTRDENEPQWWVEQAFVVTSGICLLLDMFHRPATDPEVAEYHPYVQKAIRWLQQFVTSSVAIHGVRLLISLLQEYNKINGDNIAHKASANTVPNNTANADVPMMTQDYNMQGDDRAPPLPNNDAAPYNFNFDIDNVGFDDLMDYLPVDGIDSSGFVDNMFNLASLY